MNELKESNAFEHDILEIIYKFLSCTLVVIVLYGHLKP